MVVCVCVEWIKLDADLEPHQSLSFKPANFIDSFLYWHMHEQSMNHVSLPKKLKNFFF